MNGIGQSWISRCSASAPILLEKTSNAEPSAFLRRACPVLNHTALETMWGNCRKMSSPNKTIWKQPLVWFSLTLLWECSLLPATASGTAWYWTHVKQTIPAPKEPAVQSCACFGDLCCSTWTSKVCKPFRVSVLHRWNLGKLAGTNTGHFKKDYIWYSTIVLYSQALNVVLVHDGN